MNQMIVTSSEKNAQNIFWKVCLMGSLLMATSFGILIAVISASKWLT